MVTEKRTLPLVNKWISEDGHVGTGHLLLEGMGIIM